MVWWYGGTQLADGSMASRRGVFPKLELTEWNQTLGMVLADRIVGVL